MALKTYAPRLSERSDWWGKNSIIVAMLNFAGEMTWRGQDIYVTTNELGFRDDKSLNPDDPRPMIMFFGDSFTYGYGVALEETMPNQLEEYFPEHLIFNAGGRGNAPLQFYMSFRDEILGHTPPIVPDVIVCNIYLANDLPEYLHNVQFGKDIYSMPLRIKSTRMRTREGFILRSVLLPDSAEENEEPAFPSLDKIKIYLYQHTVSVKLYVQIKKLFRKQDNSSLETNRDIWQHGKPKEEHWQEFFKTLNAFKRLCESQGTLFVVGLIPDPTEYSKEYHNIFIRLADDVTFAELSEPRERLVSHLQTNGFHFVDYYDSLRHESRLFEYFISRFDPHWNAKGIEVSTKQLAGYLRPLLGSLNGHQPTSLDTK